MTAPAGALATVDLAAYGRNLAMLRDRVAPAGVMAVVKADGYGHGLLPAARAAAAAGVEWIGALDIETGLELRAAGIPREVAVFAWLLGPDEDYRRAIEAAVDLGVSTIDQLEQIAASGAAERARVHLKIDTGLHRNGASAAEWPALVSRAVALGERIDTLGVWTHIAEASTDEDSVAIGRFRDAIAEAGRLGLSPRVRHLAASAAGFERADSRFDLVRIGAFSFGISPGGGITPSSLGLEPVMTLTAPVVATAPRTAVVAIGFGDGIPSASAGVVSLAVHGERFRVVAVEIDRLVIDVGDAIVRPGDTAVLFGPGSAGEPTLQEWADALDTIGEEIVTRLSPLVPRRYLGWS